jgi:uncharacterized membrane protein
MKKFKYLIQLVVSIIMTAIMLNTIEMNNYFIKLLIIFVIVIVVNIFLTKIISLTEKERKNKKE